MRAKTGSILLLFCIGSVTSVPLASQGLLYYHDIEKAGRSKGYEVSYDNRSFIIDGQRTLLLSGAVHYPRVTAGEWSNIFREMYLDGLNMVQTYVYWNLHEPRRGQEYDFSGNKNWTLFVVEAAKAGLFVNLRIGPFVASEWDYGGIPHWINQIPGMVVRSSNQPWESEMARFFTDIVNMARPYFATNGGPIILSQVENEFHWDDPEYIMWCGELVKTVKAGIPFGMCNGESADNTINTCNGNDCEQYAEQHAEKYPGKPLAWTENEGWYQEWDKQPLTSHDNRSASDMAYVIMKWFARGGAHHNYYMWYGGNNFGRVGGACVATEYADGVNLRSDGLPNEPKKTHLQKLHLLLGKYGDVLLNSPSQVNNKQSVLLLNTTSGKFVNTTKQFAYVYKSDRSAVAFLENSANDDVLVKFSAKNFTLPPLSSSLIDMSNDEAEERYNSGKLNATGIPTKRIYSTLMEKFSWKAWQENTTKLEGGFENKYPLEQLNVTEDLTDYLFYQTVVTEATTGVVNITVESQISDSLLAYIDGKFQSSTESCQHSKYPTAVTYTLPVNTVKGQAHTLTLLSVSLGVITHTIPGEFDRKGITGSVLLGTMNITDVGWVHRPMLQGEILHVYTSEGAKNVSWDSHWMAYTSESLVWYQFSFDAPKVNKGSSLLLDLLGMERGYIYLNGVNLGRYWLTMVDGVYVQRYYLVPKPLLMEKNNLLTLIEELGAPEPGSVKLVESKLVLPP